MRNLLMIALVGGVGYVGWRYYTGGSGPSGLSLGTPDTAAAWAAYVASDMYRSAPAAMRLKREQFDRVWAELPTAERQQLQRAYTMTQAQIAATVMSDPAFRNAVMHATERWRMLTQAPPVSGFGSYVRG